MQETPFKISYTDPAAGTRLTNRLREYIDHLARDRRIVVVCLGTDRSTGDALGPLTGSALLKYRSSFFDLYGTLEDPVHAVNLDETLKRIYQRFHHPFVIGVDACLGRAASVGYVHAGLGPIRPGAGVNKELPPVGDVHISGVVNIGGFMEYFVLQNTRLHLVVGMAELIAGCLHGAICGD
jgi:putative sporulation protein YyaC